MNRAAPTLLTLCLFAVIGCTAIGGDLPRAGTPEEAEMIAAAWLSAVEGGAPDRGWSLLHPLSRERLYGNDMSRYVAQAAAISWDKFDWQVEPPAVWDGNYAVRIAVEGDTSPAEQLADGHLIQRIQSPDGVWRLWITVLIEFNGAKGVLGP